MSNAEEAYIGTELFQPLISDALYGHSSTNSFLTNSENSNSPSEKTAAIVKSDSRERKPDPQSDHLVVVRENIFHFRYRKDGNSEVEFSLPL